MYEFITANEILFTGCSKLIDIFPTSGTIIDKKYNRISDKLPEISVKADMDYEGTAKYE
jgi:hypothetical protein